MTIHDFDAIRPFMPEELPKAFDDLLGDQQFCSIIQPFFKNIPLPLLKEQLYACKDNLEVQKKFFYPIVSQIITSCTNGVSMDASAIEYPNRDKIFTFVSNHRDIVIDPALLDVLLIDNGFRTTVEIAIGDNLLIYPWIKNLVKVNKSFIVQRSASIREMLASSKRMSQYMHFAILEKKENVWISQREGRAKDSNDRTQESVLKMMAMGGDSTVSENLKQLHIVPLTISYEYDPCDYLKAKEFQLKRDNPNYKKTMQDDLDNMKIGIKGYKGRVKYRLSHPINSWIDEIKGLAKNDFFKTLAAKIDKDIHSAYEIFPCNYIALDLLRENHEQAQHYTLEEKASFEKYLQNRLSLINLPNKDEVFLRERLLTMYANPLINHLQALHSSL